MLCVLSGLPEDDYVKLLWTTLAEFPGTILSMVLIDRIGRKRTMAVQAFLFGLATLAVMECGANKTVLVLALFGARGFTSGLFQTVYVYTPEVYPTKMRALALGKLPPPPPAERTTRCSNMILLTSGQVWGVPPPASAPWSHPILLRFFSGPPSTRPSSCTPA